jgi:hypothetical protein
MAKGAARHAFFSGSPAGSAPTIAKEREGEALVLRAF